jgi:membrane fusion protein, multidrug efflux system
MNKDNSLATPPPPPGKTSRAIYVVIGVVCLVIIAAVVLVIVRKRIAEAKQAAIAHAGQPPVPVLASTVVAKDVPVYLDGLGTVQALNTVTVRVLVDGMLKRVAFVEGQDVHAGDVLAEVDPAPYQAALEQAKAKKGQDEAMLANARLDMKREDDLFAAKVDSEQVWATQKALVDQLVAAVKADQAAIDSAQVNLDRTIITSPLEGRTGIRQVDQGNMVHATDTNGLVVITQLRPITVLATLPEQNLTAIHEEMAATHSTEFKVLAMAPDNSTILDEGKLAVIDNQIDTTTGTIRFKATFPNEQLKLWPGQWINARFLLNIHSNALVVPAAAIQRGPTNAYVFLIQKGPGKTGTGGHGKMGKTTDGTPPIAATTDAKPADDAKPKSGKPGGGSGGELLSVKIQNVTVAPQIEAGQVIVESGLEAGERVVTDGQYKLQDGSTIKISTGDKAGAVDSGPKDSMQ